MAYLISEEAQDLLQDVKNFCDKEVVEQCKEYDVSGEWPKAIYEKAIEQGYQALEVPEEYGGPGLSQRVIAPASRISPVRAFHNSGCNPDTRKHASIFCRSAVWLLTK